MESVKRIHISPRSDLGPVVAMVRAAVRQGERVELYGWGAPAEARARSIVRVLQDRGISARLLRTGRKRYGDPFVYSIPAPGVWDELVGPPSGRLIADRSGGSVALRVRPSRAPTGGAAEASDAPDCPHASRIEPVAPAEGGPQLDALDDELH